MELSVEAWILEADIYRLEKALHEADRPIDEQQLRTLIFRKRRQLETLAGRPGESARR